MNTALLPTLISKASPSLTRTVNRQALKLKKNAPHILFATGIIGSVGSTVLACRATLKLANTLDEAQLDIATVKARDMQTIDGRKDHNREMALAYIRGGARIAKLYGPAVGVGLVSYSLLGGAHVQLTRRNASLAAAYAALQASYEKYRARMIEELGPEKELEIYNGPQCLEDEEDPKGLLPGPNGFSPYARLFDETNPNFTKNAEYVRNFITCQQNYANDRLNAKGHVFLNEVYEWLGFEHTTPGSVVGWVVDGTGDGYIDFGMYEDGKLLDLSEPRIWLDFNVDGVVYDKI